MAIDTSKPIHSHNCEECIFLGVTIGGGKLMDLYVHPSHPNYPNLGDTVIARFGPEGDYYSCTVDGAKPTGHAELWAAATLWRERKTT